MSENDTPASKLLRESRDELQRLSATIPAVVDVEALRALQLYVVNNGFYVKWSDLAALFPPQPDKEHP